MNALIWKGDATEQAFTTAASLRIVTIPDGWRNDGTKDRRRRFLWVTR
ncbi:MAG: hypothetical protein WCR59_00275 [Planctomycetota bacterium]|nr:hypothetical protein [Planctomycetota bacterium]